MRMHAKLEGEVGPLYIERVLDADGEPVGYVRIRGAALLGNPDQERAFNSLGNEFHFTDAKSVYGRSDQPTTDFLKKAIAADLLRKVGRGRYRKVVAAIPED